MRAQAMCDTGGPQRKARRALPFLSLADDGVARIVQREDLEDRHHRGMRGVPPVEPTLSLTGIPRIPT